MCLLDFYVTQTLPTLVYALTFINELDLIRPDSQKGLTMVIEDRNM